MQPSTKESTPQIRRALSTTCRNCVHWNYEAWLYRDRFVCSAFPEGIPHSIWFENVPHDVPLPGQKNNITFEAAQNEE